VVVGTANEAISRLRKQKFDLMFLDLQLPDAPGDQVYKTANAFALYKQQAIDALNQLSKQASSRLEKE
jgi:CheY-like chemotaxis protein